MNNYNDGDIALVTSLLLDRWLGHEEMFWRRLGDALQTASPHYAVKIFVGFIGEVIEALRYEIDHYDDEDEVSEMKNDIRLLESIEADLTFYGHAYDTVTTLIAELQQDLDEKLARRQRAENAQEFWLKVQSEMGVIA